MIQPVPINKELFQFNYLHDYAAYLLTNKLVEFVTVGIRFSREARLPLLKPLSRLSEEELVKLSLDSNREILEAIAQRKIGELIETGAEKWINNTMGIVDRDDVLAEDLTLGFHLRRKIFAYFLDAYTKNVVLQKFIIGELDVYTTQEELISYSLYLKMQQEKLAKANADLELYKELLLEAQEFGATGSFLINFRDESKSVYTPEYRKILDTHDQISFDEFMQYVHEEDRALMRSVIGTAYKTGGRYEVEYRYRKTGPEKRIWSKGIIISENQTPLLIKGVVREIEHPRKEH